MNKRKNPCQLVPRARVWGVRQSGICAVDLTRPTSAIRPGLVENKLVPMQQSLTDLLNSGWET